MQNTKDRPQSSCQNGLQAQLTELKFSRNGEQNLQFKHLKQGKIKIQDHIDLHGKTVLQAKLETLGKILHAYQKQHRCVCLVHGKGINSPNQDAPIKFSVDFWLRQVPFVEAFCSCLPRHGGTGAIYILLKTNHFAHKTLTFSNLRSEDLF